MRHHPAAEIFPLLDAARLAELAADIEKHGMIEPITMIDGMILDGRNRYAACQIAHIEPHYEEWAGEGDPAAWVLSKNLQRRHLDTSQRAMVAARTLGYHEARAKERQEESRAKPGAQVGQVRANLPTPTTGSGRARDDAARALNVSPRTVESAKRVIETAAPALIAAVESGNVSVSAAEVLLVLPVAEQAAVVADGPTAVAGAVSDIRNHRARGTGENEWYTPGAHIEAARGMMGGIDLDPASSEVAQRTVKAGAFYSLEDDGLTQEWRGKVWLNPPYAQPAIRMFAEKAVEEFTAGRMTEGIVLTHNYTDTAWFHILTRASAAICFTRGRISFLDPNGAKAAPTQGQAFFYFGSRVAAFAEAFDAFGIVLVRHDV